ncbi:MAG: hypothetical protein IKO27_02440 [Ruminococcus sp.]|nr:hypothetical protein [Ruminococcus sp.]
MPKLIKQYACAALDSAVKRDGSLAGDWEWREKYIGREGVLSVYESVSLSPGQHFIHMEYCGGLKLRPADDAPRELEVTGTVSYFRTGTGELTDAGDELWLRTKNSEYVFKLLD